MRRNLKKNGINDFILCKDIEILVTSYGFEQTMSRDPNPKVMKSIVSTVIIW